MIFEKEMRGNSGHLPHEHKVAIDWLRTLQSPLIPKIHSYDDYYYKVDYIDGVSLSRYVTDKGDASWCQDLISDINSLFLKMSKIKYKNFVLCADGIHENNIKVNMTGQPYILDLNQFCWVKPHEVFDNISFTYHRLCNAVKTALITHELNNTSQALYNAERKIDSLVKEIGELKRIHGLEMVELGHMRSADFEAGVRHGFWNVKTKKEIFEKYENFKHLEEWFQDQDEEVKEKWYKNGKPKDISTGTKATTRS